MREELRAAAAALVVTAMPLAAVAAPGDHVWSVGWNVNGVGSSVDGSGGVGMAGTFSGTVDFGGGGATATGTDVFVTKRSASGAHEWTAIGDATVFPAVTAVACAPAGDVYVAGVLPKGGTIDFGSGPIGLPDGGLWAVRFDPDGNEVWSDTFGFGTINDIDATDALVAFAARNSGSVDFGGGALGASGDIQAIVAVLLPDRTHVWSAAYGDAATQEGREVGLLGSGDVVLMANVLGTTDFGGGGLAADADADFAFARFGAGGAHVWSRIAHGNFASFRSGMDVTPTGAICAAGAFTGTADLGGGTITSSGQDAWAVRYDSSGNHLWSVRLGGTGSDVGLGAWWDPDNQVIVSGTYTGAVDLGGGPLPAFGGGDAFLVALDTAGAHAWSRGWGTTGGEFRCEAEVGPTGDPVLSTSGGAVDFGGGAVGGSFGVARVAGDGGGTTTAPAPAPRAAPGLLLAPNPFTSATTIRFADARGAGIDAVRIVDAAGRIVRTLAPSGTSAVSWDGRDASGRPVAAGVYFVSARSERGWTTGRVVRRQ